MPDYLDMMARANRAYHDVAQLHLHEYADDRALYPETAVEEA